jgi:hypothetical protein
LALLLSEPCSCPGPAPSCARAEQRPRPQPLLVGWFSPRGPPSVA